MSNMVEPECSSKPEPMHKQTAVMDQVEEQER